MMSAATNWDDLSRNLTIVASMAEDFLELSDDEKNAIFERPDASPLSVYAGVHLAATIRQAKDMVRMLEQAESAWKEARDRTVKRGAATRRERSLTPAG
jgi:hypothetical protein